MLKTFIIYINLSKNLLPKVFKKLYEPLRTSKKINQTLLQNDLRVPKTNADVGPMCDANSKLNPPYKNSGPDFGNTSSPTKLHNPIYFLHVALSIWG